MNPAHPGSVAQELGNYQGIFEASPDPVVVARAGDGTIVLINGAFVSTFGITLDEAVGRTPVELGLWPDPEECERCVRLLQEQQHLENLPMTLRSRRGDFPFLLSAAAVRFGGEDCFVTV